MGEARSLAEAVRTVASLPEIYLRLSRVVHDPRSSADDVGQVICQDPGLTARLLRIVNSAVYDFPYSIETVSHALRVVGTLQLLDLSLATAVVRVFRDIPRDLMDMAGFWKHSLACAIGARLVGKWLRASNTERLFVAGMLHDIGRPVLALERSEGFRRALERCRRTGELLYLVESEELGFTHSEVGRELLDLWGLSPCLQEVVGNHHAPSRTSVFQVETAAVHVADVFANAMAMGSSGERAAPPLVADAWEALGLPLDAVPAILERMNIEYSSLVAEILVTEAA